MDWLFVWIAGGIQRCREPRNYKTLNGQNKQRYLLGPGFFSATRVDRGSIQLVAICNFAARYH